LSHQLSYRLQYPLGSSKYASPTKQTSVRKEGNRGRRAVAVFNFDPIVYEVSSLLSIRDASNVRDDHGFLPAVKLYRVLVHSELPYIPKCEEVKITPSVFSGKVPNFGECLSGHWRTSSFFALLPSLFFECSPRGEPYLASRFHQPLASRSTLPLCLANPLPITSIVSSASFSAGSSSLVNHLTSAASLAAARSPATRRHRKSIKT